MKLSTKLLLSYFTVAFLVLMVGAGSFYLNEHIKDELIEESQRSITEMQKLSSLNFHLQNSLIFTRNFLFEHNRERGPQIPVVQLRSRNAEDAARESLRFFAVYLDSIQSTTTDYASLEEDQHRLHLQLDHLADSLSVSFHLYQSLSLELFDLEEEVGMGDEMFNLTIEPYFRTTLLPILEEFRTLQVEWIELQMDALQVRVERNTRIVFMITFIAFVLAIGLAYLIYNSIARPLHNLTLATEEIGSGNLEKRIRIGTNDELQQLGESFNRMAENLNKSMVSREYVNNIIQSMGDMLVVTDPDYQVQLINRSISETLEYEAGALTGKPVWTLFSDTVADSIRKHLSNSNQKSSFESTFTTANGEAIPVVLSFSSLDDRKGETKGIVFVASNITVQKEAEEKIKRSLKEKEVLLSEIHHRVKNNLAVISGLLEMQVWNLSKGDINIAPLKESQLRIQSIALVHELLYQSENFSEIKLDEYIHKLLEAISNTHECEEKKIEVVANLKEVKLTIQKAIPASLILNELVVNAYKHAFTGRKEGKITVTLEEKDHRVELLVQDNGVGLPSEFEPFRQKTLGMTLIKTLIRQINGDLVLQENSSAESGTRFVIHFDTN